jgi:hypothetical protein
VTVEAARWKRTIHLVPDAIRCELPSRKQPAEEKISALSFKYSINKGHAGKIPGYPSDPEPWRERQSTAKEFR